MRIWKCGLFLIALGISSLLGQASSARAADIPSLLNTVKSVKAKGAGNIIAQQAWRQLANLPVAKLTEILTGMSGANPIAENWIRAAADTVFERAVKQGTTIPVKDLETFLTDLSKAPRARRSAYEYLLQLDAKTKQRFIPKMINDPSMELRRDAVAMALEKADKTLESGDKKTARQQYLTAFRAARHLDQIDAAKKQLDELGEKVDLPKHFGFVLNWNLIGPFDNTDKSGFDVAYPPETVVDLEGIYEGKDGKKVAWKAHRSEDKYGIVDLNKALGKHKGAIAYASSHFQATKARDIEIRVGCINGTKVWLNGKPLIIRHVYHANMAIDQYSAKGTLKPGTNHILVKVAQNEQTESWAQRWQFQLRVCDHLGTAVLATR